MDTIIDMSPLRCFLFDRRVQVYLYYQLAVVKMWRCIIVKKKKKWGRV